MMNFLDDKAVKLNNRRTKYLFDLLLFQIRKKKCFHVYLEVFIHSLNNVTSDIKVSKRENPPSEIERYVIRRNRYLSVSFPKRQELEKVRVTSLEKKKKKQQIMDHVAAQIGTTYVEKEKPIKNCHNLLGIQEPFNSIYLASVNVLLCLYLKLNSSKKIFTRQSHTYCSLFMKRKKQHKHSGN